MGVGVTIYMYIHIYTYTYIHIYTYTFLLPRMVLATLALARIARAALDHGRNVSGADLGISGGFQVREVHACRGSGVAVGQF